jgi:hypothetical protein
LGEECPGLVEGLVGAEGYYDSCVRLVGGGKWVLLVGGVPQVLKISIQLPRTCNHALNPPFGGGLLCGGGGGGASSGSASFDDALAVPSSSFSTSLEEVSGEVATV